MDNIGVDTCMSSLDWASRSCLSSFSGFRSSTFSNASPHGYDHIRVNFKGLFFSDQNWIIDKELAQLAALHLSEGGQDKASRCCQVGF